MSFNTGLSGLNAAAKNLDVIGNNIANVGSTGFKASRAEFADLYANSVLGFSNTATGSGVITANVSQQFTQGNITATGNSLDLAINGDGFFVLNKAGSKAGSPELLYTRNGTFHTDRNGYVVDNADNRLQGYAFDPATGTIDKTKLVDLQIPVPPASSPTSVSIDDDGTVSITDASGVSSIIGQVVLATFVNKQGLTPIGNSDWVESYASGPPLIGAPGSDTRGTLASGSLEESNVDLTAELVNMIVAQRNYQANAKTIETESTIAQTIIQMT